MEYGIDEHDIRRSVPLRFKAIHVSIKDFLHYLITSVLTGKIDKQFIFYFAVICPFSISLIKVENFLICGSDNITLSPFTISPYNDTWYILSACPGIQ